MLEKLSKEKALKYDKSIISNELQPKNIELE